MRGLLTVLFLVFLTGCNAFKADVDPITGKKVRKEPNLKTRGEDFAKEGGGIFNSSKMQGGTTYDFATSNILWRATLTSLDFIPLQSANYSGGVVVTDWYSNDINSDESIKIEVRFLSSEISANSFNITSYKKICKNLNCQISKMNKDFNDNLKSTIMTKVREMKVEEELKKKKKS